MNQIETLLQKKREQITHETHEIYRENNFENLIDRVSELEQQIQIKSRALDRNQALLKEFEDQSFERTTQFLTEETQMKARLENLSVAQTEIDQKVKPQLMNL